MFRFKPRVYVHPDRYGADKTLGPNRLIVIHTSEGSEIPTSAENLCTYMGMPGDRISDSGSRFGASYHYVTDTDEGVFPAVMEKTVAYAAAGANSDGIHICIPGKAGQTRAQWLDFDSRAHINSLAWAMQRISIANNIPLTRLTDAQIAAGHWGYCDHHAISRVYKRSDHTDVGGSFPWDFLAGHLIPTPGGPLLQMQRLGADVLPRLFDTVVPGHSAGQFAEFQVTDPAAANARGLLANFTFESPAGSLPGYVTMWPANEPQPLSSKLNPNGGHQVTPNEVTVWLSADRKFRVFTPQALRLVCDVTGYWV